MFHGQHALHADEPVVTMFCRPRTVSQDTVRRPITPSVRLKNALIAEGYSYSHSNVRQQHFYRSPDGNTIVRFGPSGDVRLIQPQVAIAPTHKVATIARMVS